MDRHQPHLTDSYAQLLRRLRKDLELDLNTDTLQVPLLPAQAQALVVDVGTVSFTWTAAVASAAQVVPHHLGRLPLAVLLQSTTNLVDAAVTALSTTSFTANGFDTANAAITSTIAFYWIAIG